MSEKPPIPRNRIKARTGCLRCKQRKIKCDEAVPHCNQCTRRAYDCPGYIRPLKWSSKYEIPSQPKRQRLNSSSRLQDVSISTGTSNRPQAGILNIRPQSVGCDDLGVPTDPPARDPSKSNTTEHTTASVSECSTFNDHPLTPFGNGLETPNTEFDGYTVQDRDSFTGFFLESSGPTHSLLSSLEDEDTAITKYYFSHVCYINSCFDSHQNTFRVEVGNMINSSPLLYHCILSMSAAHMAAHRNDKATTALNHRTQALSYLTGAVMKLKELENLGDNYRANTSSEALLGSILLGMTDGWHSPSLLGISHLHSARVIFKNWQVQAKELQDHATRSSSMDNFMIGIMAYWEAVISFVIDQPLDTVNYLERYCDQKCTFPMCPNPWTGICTPMFIYLSKVGTLGRQRSLIRNISPIASTMIRDRLLEDLLVQAREIETTVLRYTAPDGSEVEDTGDILTPVSHLQKMAQIYRFSTLLELYQVFPELLQANRDESDYVNYKSENLTDLILSLATNILTIICTVPHTSGVNCVLTIPLLIAGSALQPTSPTSIPRQHQPSVPTCIALAAELRSLSSDEDVRLHWRRVARQRLQAVHNHVGIASVYRAVEILDKVWDRADVQAIMNPHRTFNELIHWTKVMTEEKLETVLG